MDFRRAAAGRAPPRPPTTPSPVVTRATAVIRAARARVDADPSQRITQVGPPNPDGPRLLPVVRAQLGQMPISEAGEYSSPERDHAELAVHMTFTEWADREGVVLELQRQRAGSSTAVLRVAWVNGPEASKNGLIAFAQTPQFPVELWDGCRTAVVVTQHSARLPPGCTVLHLSGVGGDARGKGLVSGLLQACGLDSSEFVVRAEFLERNHHTPQHCSGAVMAFVEAADPQLWKLGRQLATQEGLLSFWVSGRHASGQWAPPPPPPPRQQAGVPQQQRPPPPQQQQQGQQQQEQPQQPHQPLQRPQQQEQQRRQQHGSLQPPAQGGRGQQSQDKGQQRSLQQQQRQREKQERRSAQCSFCSLKNRGSEMLMCERFATCSGAAHHDCQGLEEPPARDAGWFCDACSLERARQLPLPEQRQQQQQQQQQQQRRLQRQAQQQLATQTKGKRGRQPAAAAPSAAPAPPAPPVPAGPAPAGLGGDPEVLPDADAAVQAQQHDHTMPDVDVAKVDGLWEAQPRERRRLAQLQRRQGAPASGSRAPGVQAPAKPRPASRDAKSAARARAVVAAAAAEPTAAAVAGWAATEPAATAARLPTPPPLPPPPPPSAVGPPPAAPMEPADPPGWAPGLASAVLEYAVDAYGAHLATEVVATAVAGLPASLHGSVFLAVTHVDWRLESGCLPAELLRAVQEHFVACHRLAPAAYDGNATEAALLEEDHMAEGIAHRTRAGRLAASQP